MVFGCCCGFAALFVCFLNIVLTIVKPWGGGRVAGGRAQSLPGLQGSGFAT